MNNFLRELIQQDYTLITASHRQARYLRSAHASSMMEQGHTVWQTPPIHPWKQWLKQCWEEKYQVNDISRPRLLSSAQTRMLWLSIIEKSRYVDSKLQINSIVDQAIRAYETCLEWRLDIFPEGIFLNTDTQAFKSWANTYRERIQQENWLDELGLADYLVKSAYKPDAHGVVVYGFDELNPQQQAFLQYLKVRDCQVEFFKSPGRNQSTRYYEFPESRNEIRSAAVWARKIIDEEPDSSIGIVIPDLDYRREYVSAIFDDILNPGWIVQKPDSINSLYSIAPGRPLSDYPVIHAALQILALGEYRQRIQRFEFLLRSSYIKGNVTESGLRARFYSALRAIGEPSWHIKTLLDFIDSHQKHFPVAKGFVNMLRELRTYLDQLPPGQTPKQWSESFTHCLKLFGWPGERSLNSSEYQTLLEWRQVLLTFADLGTVCGKFDYLQAFEYLKQILAERSFQPETIETPLQISGLPGVSGMKFDHLWVSGVHDLNWPGPTSSNPFIPLALQREAGVPGSSAEINMKRCQLETQELISSTSHLIFSYARMQENTECRPSTILKEFISDTPDFTATDYKQLIFSSSLIETLIDTQTPTFSHDEIAGGGTSILTDQSACPFRAFARHRLKARGLDEIDIGLDPARRGLLVHAVMQGVWNRIGNSDNLQAMSGEKLNSLIKSVVSSVIHKQARHQPETYTSGFCQLEGRRLVSLVRQWMEIERTRPGFSVLELEKKHQVNFHGLNIRMRIDRVDELEGGGQVLIDYKTGEVNVKKWQGERPEEPQMPLYAVTHDGDTKAVVYAGMKKGKLAYTGLAEKPDLIDGVQSVSELPTEHVWQQCLAIWDASLAKLAGEYLQGQADVAPRDKQACRTCDLHTLCRIHERDWLLSDTSEDLISWEE
jgi:probable DNA repair protein